MAEMDAQILENSLNKIQAGEATLEDCLRDHPEQAEALGSFLRTAALARMVLAPAGPTDAFRASSEARVLNRMRDRIARPQTFKKPAHISRRLSLRPAYRLVGALLAAALIIGTASVAYASGEALPGDPLYRVKIGVEQAALVLSPSAAWDARLHLGFAGRRLREAEALVGLDRDDDLAAALEGYAAALGRALELAATDEAGMARLGAALELHEETLGRVLEKAPERAKLAVTNALERSREGKQAVEQIQQGEHPSETAPGQLNKTPEAEKQKGKTPKPKNRTPGPPATVAPADDSG